MRKGVGEAKGMWKGVGGRRKGVVPSPFIFNLLCRDICDDGYS